MCGPLHPSLAFFFSFSFCLSFYSSPSSAFNLASSLPPPPPSTSLSLSLSLSSFFSPNLSIRSVDKLFMPLSPKPCHLSSCTRQLLCLPSFLLPSPLLSSPLPVCSTSSSASVSFSPVLQKARPHTIIIYHQKWCELIKRFRIGPPAFHYETESV